MSIYMLVRQQGGEIYDYRFIDLPPVLVPRFKALLDAQRLSWEIRSVTPRIYTEADLAEYELNVQELQALAQVNVETSRRIDELRKLVTL